MENEPQNCGFTGYMGRVTYRLSYNQRLKTMNTRYTSILAREKLAMASVGELFGIFACLVPIVAIVVYMAWATRRKVSTL